MVFLLSGLILTPSVRHFDFPLPPFETHTYSLTNTHTHSASFTERQQSANLSLFSAGSDIIQPVINFNETLYGGEILEGKIN